MLYTVIAVLVILWLLGLLTSDTMGGLIHLLLGHRARRDCGPPRCNCLICNNLQVIYGKIDS